MTDLSRIDSMYSLLSKQQALGTAVASTEVIAAATGVRHVIHTVVVSSGAAASFTLKENSGGVRTTKIPELWYPANGGIGLHEMFEKLQSGASLEITTTGNASSSFFCQYHSENSP